MPDLDEIQYSREETVTAVLDYYTFLTKMHLKESDIIEPPAEGWPDLGVNLQCLEKTDEVLLLLSHLPFIREHSDDNYKPQSAPFCYFADWQKFARQASVGDTDGLELRMLSEKAEVTENVPPHVISLTSGGRRNPAFLLDTKLGIIHWYECPNGVKDNPSREPVTDDPYDYADDEEAEWIAEGESWAIGDFFEVLKGQFRKLRFLPRSSHSVMAVYSSYGPKSSEIYPALQKIYREHGWPDLDQYRKEECLLAVQSFLKESYPDYAD